MTKNLPIPCKQAILPGSPNSFHALFRVTKRQVILYNSVMAGLSSTERSFSDSAVRARTGRSWDQWFDVLDAAGAESMEHPAIARWLRSEQGVSLWWSQMITGEYEKARGRRVRNQMPDGFQISVSRTLNSPLEKAWRALAQESDLVRWYAKDAAIDFRKGGVWGSPNSGRGILTTLNPLKNFILKWEQAAFTPGSVVEFSLTPKDDGRCVVTLQHRKIALQEEASELRDQWSGRLDSLRGYLETGQGSPVEE